VECLLKVALVRMGYHGTAVQAEQPSFVKVLWLLVFLHWKFDCARSKTEASEEALTPQKPTSRFFGASGRRCAKYEPPLRSLLRQRPDLFARAPARPPPAPPARAAARDRCGACGFTAACGWGNPACTECSQADAVLAEALSQRSSTQGPRSLDRLLLAVEASC